MNHKISRSIYKRILSSFWRSLTLYTVIMGIMGFGAYMFLSSKIWYGDELEYDLLYWMHRYIFVVIILMILAGATAICLLYFNRLARMIEQMTEAVDAMHRESPPDHIELPEILLEAEQALNKILDNTKENSRRMEEIQQQKNDMIMYMAHDLKTPLTSVLGYLTLLNDEKEISDETRQRYIHVALEKAYRLEELIHDFFDITRLRFSNMILETERINLTRMAEQVAYEFMPVFQGKNLSYTFHSEGNYYAKIDTPKMQRVFDNLLKNCVNYSYPGTTIQINMSENKKGECVFEIINHGKTIPKEKLDRIFERFYRMDSSRASKDGGAGLGLAITRQIVEAHGGRIWCESENEMIKFSIRLPISKDSFQENVRKS